MTSSGATSLQTSGRGRHGSDDLGRTPAQWFCLLVGAVLVLVGILGFFADATFDAGGELQGDALLGFEVNGWHNLVHIASGLLLLSAFRKAKSAKTIALAFGIVYGIVTLIGLIDGDDVLGLFPVNPADNVLHIALTATAILAAIASRGHDREDVARDGTVTDRSVVSSDSHDDRLGERVPARDLNRR